MIIKIDRQTRFLQLGLAFMFVASNILSQNESLSLDDIPSEKVQVKEAFNGPNVILNQSTNMLQSKRLDLVFGHRFGKLNEGGFNAFGLDQAYIRIGFEYGIKDWLTVGLGRTSLGKNYDLFLKHRPLVQTKGGGKNIPVSVIVFFSSAFSSNELRRQNQIYQDGQFINQLVYTFQSSVSRQFSTRFSTQLTGSFVHRNSVPSTLYDNNIYALGAGFRIKLNNRIHFLAEYNYLLNKPDGIYDPIAIGIDIVAGGHVFNVHFTNSVGILEKDFLTNTVENVTGIRLGFLIRRSFMLKPNVDGGKVKI